jgi:Mlc titration factor MtfA (ptsG expression regulator)
VETLFTIIGLTLVVALVLMPGFVPALFMRRAPQARVPAQLGERLSALLPQRVRLTPELCERHRRRAEGFLRRVEFEGCQGLAITDEMRIAVAGYACLLCLRPGDDRTYPALRKVLIYPGAFAVPHSEPDEFGLVSDEPVAQIGESWRGDRVVLSWDDIVAAVQGDDGNVVVHEFAHQLDDETPDLAGAPALRDYGRWSEVMRREYERLRRHRRPPVLDPYGGESPAEFFAVATEAFIQRGEALARHHPELYALFAEYYGFDTRDPAPISAGNAPAPMPP